MKKNIIKPLEPSFFDIDNPILFAGAVCLVIAYLMARPALTPHTTIINHITKVNIINIQVKETPRDNIEYKIKKGLRTYSELYYGGQPLPSEDHISQFIEASKKYPFFKKHPYLLPTLTILETSGGLNITRPNNLVNWAIRLPENNEAFSHMTRAQVLDRAISGIGERDINYIGIRDTGDLLKFANKYEPCNESYYTNMLKMIGFFERQK